MKIIVAHKSPDLDALTSMWLLKRFAPGWENAILKFVPAGDKLEGPYQEEGEVIEKLNGDDVIHVDTGLGKLDHHQTQDHNTCAASLTFKYVTSLNNNYLTPNKHKTEAVRRIVEVAIDVDHFQEVFFPNPESDMYDFSLVSVLDGYRMQHPGEDEVIAEFGMQLLDSILHELENKLWAEEELDEKGKEFETKWGKAIAVETLNDEVLKLAQRMGYVVAVRKDPKYGTVRIKGRPVKRDIERDTEYEEIDIDFTPVYEELKKRDPDASWFLHVSKRMLLNGSSKNPQMKGSKITLPEVIEILSAQ